MGLSELLLPEFEREMQTTRRVLERVPEDKRDFRPHPTSMTLDRLAGHVADLVSWATTTLRQDIFDLAPAGGPGYEALVMVSRDELLKTFDARVAEARAALEKASDDDLGKPWSLLSGGQAIFSMPRIAVWRSFVMNHLVHHRGQLSVYLRMNGVPVPSLYGPSGDEQSFE